MFECINASIFYHCMGCTADVVGVRGWNSWYTLLVFSCTVHELESRPIFHELHWTAIIFKFLAQSDSLFFNVSRHLWKLNSPGYQYYVCVFRLWPFVCLQTIVIVYSNFRYYSDVTCYTTQQSHRLLWCMRAFWKPEGRCIQFLWLRKGWQQLQLEAVMHDVWLLALCVLVCRCNISFHLVVIVSKLTYLATYLLTWCLWVYCRDPDIPHEQFSSVQSRAGKT